jgi:activator of HSP90 ATPase
MLNIILANKGMEAAFYIPKEVLSRRIFDAVFLLDERLNPVQPGVEMMTITDSKTNSSAFAITPTRRQLISGAAIAFGALTLGAAKTFARREEEISHSAESIHMENVFAASRKRVYDALTDAKQFNEIVKLSAAVKSGMVKDMSPAEISREVGGTFNCFGGFIIGRHLELLPNERIVQAWRVSYWEAGAFSIVKFKLTEEGSGTKIIFDHTGFPNGDAENLAAGWKGNYWEPLAKFLA